MSFPALRTHQKKRAKSRIQDLTLSPAVMLAELLYLRCTMRTASAAAAGSAATAAALAASSADHGFPGLLITYHTANDKRYYRKQYDQYYYRSQNTVHNKTFPVLNRRLLTLSSSS